MYGFSEWLQDRNRDWDATPFTERFSAIFLLVKAGLDGDTASYICDIKDEMEAEARAGYWDKLCDVCDLGWPEESGCRCKGLTSCAHT